MNKVDVLALRNRLLSGAFTESDLDQAGELVKGLRDGTVQAADLVGLEGILPAAPAPAAPAAVPTPAPAALAKALETQPAAKAAINAVPALQALVGHYESIAESLAQMEAARAADAVVLKSLAARLESMEGTLQKSLSGAVVPESRGDRQELLKSIGADTARALAEALAASGIPHKLAELDEAVNRRAYSGNPSRAQAAGGNGFRKGLGGGAELDKGACISLIQKSLSAGRLNETEAQDALAQLDLAPRAGVPFAEIVRRFDNKTLMEYTGG